MEIKRWRRAATVAIWLLLAGLWSPTEWKQREMAILARHVVAPPASQSRSPVRPSGAQGAAAGRPAGDSRPYGLPVSYAESLDSCQEARSPATQNCRTERTEAQTVVAVRGGHEEKLRQAKAAVRYRSAEAGCRVCRGSGSRQLGSFAVSSDCTQSHNLCRDGDRRGPTNTRSMECVVEPSPRASTRSNLSASSHGGRRQKWAGRREHRPTSWGASVSLSGQACTGFGTSPGNSECGLWHTTMGCVPDSCCRRTCPSGCSHTGAWWTLQRSPYGTTRSPGFSPWGGSDGTPCSAYGRRFRLPARIWTSAYGDPGTIPPACDHGSVHCITCCETRCDLRGRLQDTQEDTYQVAKAATSRSCRRRHPLGQTTAKEMRPASFWPQTTCRPGGSENRRMSPGYRCRHWRSAGPRSSPSRCGRCRTSWRDPGDDGHMMLCRGGPAGLGSCLTAWLECLLHLGQMLFGKLLEAGSLPLCRPPELYSMRVYFPVQAGLSVQCSEGAPFCTCNSLSFLLSSPWIRAVIPSVQIVFSISHPLPTGMPYRGAPPTCVRSSHQATYCNLSSCGGAWPILPRLRSLCCFCDRVRAVFRGCVTHLPLLGRLSTQTKQVAPKRRIGGSGTPAPCKVAVLSRQADLWELLDMAQDLITPFFLSLMLLGFCSIMSLLALKADGRSSPLGTLCRSPFDWAPVHVALAFGGFSPRLQVSCLDWHPCNLSSREKRLQRKKGQLSKSRAASGCGQKGYRPTWFGLPQRYYSPLFRVIPVFIISASQLQAVSAMTAPYGNYDVEPPDDFPDAPSMHEPTFSGRNQVHLPWLSVANAESPHVRELPTAAPAVLDDDRERWLGVYVHTPFFPTVSFAIQPSPEAKAYGIIDAIQDHVGGVPHELYPVIVPVLPQRYPGYASFVRMPRVIRDAGGADATAIIIDLTRIGGNYFAEVVPRRLSYAQLMLKIKPGATNHSGDFHVFFGRNQTPWLAGEFVTMYDGAVVTVATSVDAPVHCGSFEDLIANEAEWGPISRMPTDVTIRGSLVQHQGKSFFLPAEQTAQNGISQTVCACLDEDIHEVTTCDFPFHDLTFKGFVCDKIFCVFNLPWPGTDRLQGQRRDIFTLCDARAVGVLPSVLHTCHPVIHLPSLAARMRIHLPVAMRLDAVGGRRAFDEVFIDENAALVLFASHLSSASEEAPEEEVASSDIMQADDDEPPSPRSPAAPWDRRGDDVPEAWRRRPTIFTPEARRIAEARFDSVLADNEGYETGILGVALFAPHYQAEFIAIHCKPGEAVNEVIARTRQAAERIPVAHLECSAVVEPLPFEGYATVMVLTSARLQRPRRSAC